MYPSRYRILFLVLLSLALLLTSGSVINFGYYPSPHRHKATKQQRLSHLPSMQPARLADTEELELDQAPSDYSSLPPWSEEDLAILNKAISLYGIEIVDEKLKSVAEYGILSADKLQQVRLMHRKLIFASLLEKDSYSIVGEISTLEEKLYGELERILGTELSDKLSQNWFERDYDFEHERPELDPNADENLRIQAYLFSSLYNLDSADREKIFSILFDRQQDQFKKGQAEQAKLSVEETPVYPVLINNLINYTEQELESYLYKVFQDSIDQRVFDLEIGDWSYFRKNYPGATTDQIRQYISALRKQEIRWMFNPSPSLAKAERWQFVNSIPEDIEVLEKNIFGAELIDQSRYLANLKSGWYADREREFKDLATNIGEQFGIPSSEIEQTLNKIKNPDLYNEVRAARFVDIIQATADEASAIKTEIASLSEMELGEYFKEERCKEFFCFSHLDKEFFSKSQLILALKDKLPKEKLSKLWSYMKQQYDLSDEEYNSNPLNENIVSE
jgi:hypothetical protein